MTVVTLVTVVLVVTGVTKNSLIFFCFYLKLWLLKNSNCDKLKNSNCDKTWKHKLWPDSKTQIVTTQKLKLWQNWKFKLWGNSNTNPDKTQKLKLWHNFKNSNCYKTQKLKLWHNSKCDKNQKLKFWQKLKTLTIVIVTVVTVVIATPFSKNNLTPRQPMRCSRCSFFLFLRCFFIIRPKGRPLQECPSVVVVFCLADPALL